MNKNNIQAPLMLEAVTYLGIATMALLGVSELQSLRIKLAILGLCLLFGIVFRLYLKSAAFQKNPNLYFGIQTFILTLVALLGSQSLDAFNFLFLLLSIHTALVLPGKPAAVWIIVYYVIVIGIMFLTQSMNGWYAILFYLITYVVCGFFGYALRQAELERDRNQQLVDELQATQQKLQELAVLEERNRLARDLHDSVKQQVFAISMQLSAARMALSETDKAYQPIVEAERLAQQAGSELTSLIHQLRPPKLEQQPFADAIKEQVDEWASQNQIEAKANINPNISLSVQGEQALFRILQEALSNVARHSSASQVMVSLKSETGKVKLIVEDNGIGYDTERITRGIGLDSMKERLAAVNGDLEITSQPSRGTCVIATVRRA